MICSQAHKLRFLSLMLLTCSMHLMAKDPVQRANTERSRLVPHG